MRKKDSIFEKIAEALLADYSSIYYINAVTNEYRWYSSDPEFHSLNIVQSGDDFFKNLDRDTDQVVYEDDRSLIKDYMRKENLISRMNRGTVENIRYRLMIEGKPVYHELRVIRGLRGSGDYFILGVKNIDKAVKEQQEQSQLLNDAYRMARIDALTGTQNKTAYSEFEKNLQSQIDSGAFTDPFSVVVCDINDLKYVNDNYGHNRGDEHIRSAGSLICHVFSHSRVFRIGGDEFVVFLFGRDYDNREILLDTLRSVSRENINRSSGPVVASGMSDFDYSSDKRIADVFNRADSIMYVDKTLLKEIGPVPVTAEEHENALKLIPEERKRMVDDMFEAFSIVAEGAYVYVCDMEYDFSRWSRAAVDVFELPSECMYGAGEIWSRLIHSKDRGIYNDGIAAIFSGSAMGHDMQYRVRRPDGEYDVCTCKGIVLKRENGKPEYFVGVIRNHGVQSYLDSLTGLRNQYGFFEDIQSNLRRQRKMCIMMVGIAKFSEINEIYGYRFGNIVLQRFGRYLSDLIGSGGDAYRFDGAKFIVLSTARTAEYMQGKYEELRAYCRSELEIDEKHILLELNCGLLSADDFDIDYQTICTCLNFAYGESKLRKHGDLAEFHNDLNYGNKQSIEMLHSIRASITRGYEGFYLLYQPVVDAHTERVIGAEALLRWKNDKYNTVPPDNFIPLLEKDPLFPQLGRWILSKALNEAKSIIEDNPDFIMNVNLSYTQLERPDFVDMVLSILDRVGYPAEHLCLEITERCRLLDITLLKNVAGSLRSRGVQIALDDFGTGFSSVAIIKDIPFDIIKIDRSFVARIEQDNKERALIKSFISMASTYSATVCVEGIENSGMRDILQHYGVHSLQGFYYAKPLEAGEFREWIKRNNSIKTADCP